MGNLHKAIQRLCAVLLGLVFFASGIVKIIDPVGVKLIFEEYFKFMHLTWLTPAAGVFGVALPLLETLAGAALVSGLWKRLLAGISGLMVVFFLGISVALVIANPEMDCGCFGEAVHLSHFQTLLKNIILLIFWCVAFLPFPWKEEIRKGRLIAFCSVVLLVGFLCVRSLVTLPIVDFTAFAPGNDIYTASSSAVVLEEDEAYSKDFYSGEDNPILGLRDISGEYCDSVAYEGRIMAMSIYDPSKISPNEWKNIASWTLDCAMEEFTPLVIVSGTPEDMDTILNGLGQEFSYLLEASLYFSDYKTLITLNRSNGGVTYISDAMVVEKWAANRRPDLHKLHSLAGFDPVEEMLRVSTHGRIALESIAGICVAVLLIL